MGCPSLDIGIKTYYKLRTHNQHPKGRIPGCPTLSLAPNGRRPIAASKAFDRWRDVHRNSENQGNADPPAAPMVHHLCATKPAVWRLESRAKSPVWRKCVPLQEAYPWVQICHLMVQKCRMGVRSPAARKFTSRLGNRRKLARIMTPSGNCLSKKPGKSPGVQKYPAQIGKRRSASRRSLGKSIENRSALRNKPSKIGKITSHREIAVAARTRSRPSEMCQPPAPWENRR